MHKRLSIQSLIFANFIPMSTICQVYYFIVGGDLTRKRDFTWRVSDCEELVGVTHRRDDVTDIASITGVCSGFLAFYPTASSGRAFPSG